MKMLLFPFIGIIATLFFGFSLFLSPEGEAQAATPPKIQCPPFLPGCASLQFSWSYRDNHLFTVVVPSLISWIMRISASAAILMGVISGIMFLYAGANEELKTRATKTFIYAGVGLLIAMFSYFIVEMINRFPYPNS